MGDQFDTDDPFKPLSATVQPKRLIAQLTGTGKPRSEKQIAAYARGHGHNVRKRDTKYPKGSKRGG